MPALIFPKPTEGVPGAPSPAPQRPELIVEIGRVAGWQLGVAGSSELGTTTSLADFEWVDISDNVLSASIRRGRQHELDRVEAGTASVSLLNQDGAFNPTNTTSPYYPTIRPMTPFRIRAEFPPAEDVPVVPPFSPLDIAGLAAWYDYSVIGTLFQDTARTTPITADAQIIKGVTDASGSGNHLSEATNGPAYTVTIKNGLSVARFDGTNDRLQLVSNLGADASWTVFIVAVKRTSADTASRTLFSFETANSSQLLTDSDNVSATAWGFYNGAFNNIGGTHTNWTSIVARVNSAASLDIYMGGGSPTNLNPADAIATGARALTQGSQTGGGNHINADIGEVLVYDSALVSADMNLVGNYLATKWAVAWSDIA